ncbi:MAG: hypothetical protein K940chlam7_01718 [Chlamydiae bacterium]|nr:hypothetical protein [Chlamydiota bacterium]
MYVLNTTLENIAHYFSNESLITLREDNSATIRSFATGEEQKVLLDEFSLEKAPAEIRHRSKKAIRSLLRQGYVPILKERKITLVHSPVDSTTPLKSIPNEQEMLTVFNQSIDSLREKIFENENDTDENLICPITYSLFEDPVIDDHGHTFEKKAIEAHLSIGEEQTCPISREKILTLTLNRSIRDLAIRVRNTMSIPVFLEGEIVENLDKANRYFALAKQFEKEEEYEDAFTNYETGLRFTQRSEDYLPIPILLKKMGKTQESELSLLYLAKRFFQEGKRDQAKRTLFTFDHSDTNPSVTLVRATYLHHSREFDKAYTHYRKLADEYKKAGQTTKTVLYLQKALSCKPDDFELYDEIDQFLTDPTTRALHYLKGFLSFNNKAGRISKRFLYMARLRSPQLPLIYLTQLSQLDKMKEKRIVVLRLLGQLFLDIEDSPNALHYLKKATQSGLDQDFKNHAEAALRCGADDVAKQVYLQWVQNLCSRKEYDISVQLLDKAVILIGAKTDLLEKQRELYTHLRNDRALRGVILKLGAIYEKEGNIAKAVEVYQVAYEKFRDDENSFKLAENLAKMGKRKESVKIYYQLSSSAYTQNSLSKVSLYIQKIQQLDPMYTLLNDQERFILTTQTHVTNLSKQLTDTQKKLENAEKELGEIKKSSEVKRYHNMRPFRLLQSYRIQRSCNIGLLRNGKAITISRDGRLCFFDADSKVIDSASINERIDEYNSKDKFAFHDFVVLNNGYIIVTYGENHEYGYRASHPYKIGVLNDSGKWSNHSLEYKREDDEWVHSLKSLSTGGFLSCHKITDKHSLGDIGMRSSGRRRQEPEPKIHFNILIWSSTGKPERVIHFNDALHDLIETPSRTLLCLSPGKITSWSLDRGNCLKNVSFEGLHGCFARFPDGSIIVQSSHYKQSGVILLDNKMERCVQKFMNSFHSNVSISVLPEGTFALFGGNPAIFQVWDPITGECLQTIKLNRQDGYGTGVLPDRVKLINNSLAVVCTSGINIFERE